MRARAMGGAPRGWGWQLVPAGAVAAHACTMCDYSAPLRAPPPLPPRPTAPPGTIVDETRSLHEMLHDDDRDFGTDVVWAAGGAAWGSWGGVWVCAACLHRWQRRRCRLGANDACPSFPHSHL